MLTGDAKAVGESVAKDLGLDEAYTQLLPGDKVDRVEPCFPRSPPRGSWPLWGMESTTRRCSPGRTLALHGCPGSDAAIEAADIVLMDDKPSKIAKAMEISQRTLRIVRQNIVFALAVKLLVLALTPFGIANMWELSSPT